VVWSIYTKGIDARNDLLYNIMVWRLKEGKTSGKKKSWEQEKRKRTDLIHRGGGGRSHGKGKMTNLKD
jgi:hypothetical protein